MSNKVIGKFHEKRGDDSFEVVLDPSGEVIGITQYMANQFRTQQIELWVESAPKMIALFQKAAGIKVVEPEYEYAIQAQDSQAEGAVRPIKEDEWGTLEAATSKVVDFQRIVKRRKAGQIEDA